MPIKFECTECHKIVTAPDAAGGKRGKCPFCGRLVDIPLPPPPPKPEEEDPDLIPLAPIDEDEERKLAQERKALYAQEQGLLDAMGPSADDGPPVEQRDDLSSQDLHHFVVNYLLDMFEGNLVRAATHADKLRGFGFAGIGAVDDFLEGNADEPALKHVPKPIREGFLRELKARVK